MRTFAGIDSKYSSEVDSKILLQSIPYDGTSTWGKGADKGFEAFLEAAENMELFDIETGTEVYKQGIHMPPAWSGFNTPEAMYNHVYEHTQSLLKSDHFLSFFGGEHSISIGIIKAFYEHYNNLSVLQIDAHADLRPEYLGSPYNHACALHDASQNCHLVQVGIRSMDQSEEKFMNKEQVYFAHQMHQRNIWMEQSINQLNNDVYITLDLDALDPSIMPATGTPEPGGLSWHQITSYLSKVFQHKNVVGFDLVELAPIEGLKAPQFLAAKLYYKMLSYKFYYDVK